MWIVRIALQRPYTFLVMALTIVLATPYMLLTMATDILPDINIPVISIIWNYSGLSAQEMGYRITAPAERILTTTVNDIEHIESQSYNSIGIIKIFFQPGANIATAIAQTLASEQVMLRTLPTGTTSPLIITYSASAIPVTQLALSSPTLPEQKVFDAAFNALRPQLVTIPGVAIPFPYGGKQRIISVDIDNSALLAKGLTPLDVVNAISAQNLILPSGTAKMGPTEFGVSLNGAPETIEGLNNLPVRTVNGAVTYLREVAHVRDGFLPQTNIVRLDGVRGVLMSIIKNGSASTLRIVETLKQTLPGAEKLLPPGITVRALFDQSVYVRAAISGVLREALIAAGLTAALILLFLGNWRATVIIAISIPLSILSSLLVLDLIGETINIMTLGGLALAVGILVDDATVTIENIERHLHLGTGLYDSIYEGAGEIALPALVSTLCICIVFTPMFFLAGVSKFLFVPLAEAVVFAMLASYILSRTLVPTLALLLLRAPGAQEGRRNFFQRLHHNFDAAFEKMRGVYVVLLSMLLTRRRIAGSAFLLFCLASLGLFFTLGKDFFPTVNANAIRLHVRAPTGLRIEETARLADEVDRFIRTQIPPNELQTIVDNIGLPYSGINLSYSNAGTIGTLDAEIMIALTPEHRPSQSYIDDLRRKLPEKFPGVEFFFQPADIVTQILNFGQPAAINVQIVGANVRDNFARATKIANEIKKIPGAVDVHILQRLDQPNLLLAMDRTRLQQVGINAISVGQNVLISLSGSSQTSPTFWLNPRNGVSYNITAQTPQYRIGSVNDLLAMPVNSGTGDAPQLLGNLVRVEPGVLEALVSHYNLRPAVDIYVSVEGRALGGVAGDVAKIVDAARADLPRGSEIALRGQAVTMKSSYFGLGLGVLVAIVLVYLLIVVNFQSLLDPLIIISALPAALAGIVWMLFLTGTRLSVPALTGAIMTTGVATANSILLVSFARERLRQGAAPLSAALEAGATRIRPVLMTAFAMIVGMIPMALGLGEGAEQNAPLGRAVIGGLLFATFSTLLFVPLVFAGAHSRHARAAGRGGDQEATPAP
ncbi:efflux RND transporter permease subunit [Rhodoblastus acidophilus]|uniref:Efflux RND transporter permease subunit n=1 Tax=Candidatus Rhodoblastus alkanivorans TaxID=2954117 RepID=A0ABS9ZBC0_9HYPH|nr:efflux RND transporter permease subunit [Candidatus Rhodoblastus alkanivorans]MCI4677144.1 efflux RND transporter permease subunit [Candidatus Rhodoblastus alkanivorans]MCI4684497.1 efflux RND transporter permease subunit [Candidatus Rhodoblastus alkanivorans]MDI4641818.1 efflux RND transporter permease subunit [Rhodoblastus acidophilus]